MITWKVIGRFFDENMPKLQSVTKSERDAFNEGYRFHKMYASLKSISIYCPGGAIYVYGGNGEYQFTIPPLPGGSE